MSQLHHETDHASDASDGVPCPNGPVMERIAARTATVGEGLSIRRAMPSPARRMVGAWCFLDHAGPLQFPAGQGLHVGPHPHIGLQTFTWMIEGEVLHRDSLGYEQVIRPGEVNIMTAGAGIAHSEDAVHDGQMLHAAQLWIALPQAERGRAPGFAHHAALPVIEQGGFRLTILAGSALGVTSPVQVYSPLVGVDVCAAGQAEITLPLNPNFEYAALTLCGTASVAGETLAPGTLLYLGTGRSQLSLHCTDAAQILLLGGEPFQEDIVLWWNFVARSQAEIEAAVQDWNTGQRFGTVAGSLATPLQAPSLQGLHLRPSR